MPLPNTVDQDVTAFYEELLKEGELSPEETTLLEGIIGKEKVWKKFKSGIHARRRFDQEMDKVKKDREAFETKYETELKNLQDLRETLSTADGATKQELANLRAAIKGQETRLFNIVQKAKEYTGGLDFLKEVGLSEDTIANLAVPATKVEEKSSTSAQSLTKEELMKEVIKEITPMRDILANLPFDLVKMDREYHSLTGKHLDPDEFRAKVFSDKRHYMEIYEQDYDIPALRAQKQQETMRAEIEKDYKDKFETWKTEHLLPTEQRVERTSDFSKAIEGTIPKEAREEHAAIGDGNVLGDAVAMFEKLKAKKEAA